MGGSVGGRDPDFGVATWKSNYGQKRGRDMKLISRHRLVSRRFATWSWHRDLAWARAGAVRSQLGCRDLGLQLWVSLVSRPGV